MPTPLAPASATPFHPSGTVRVMGYAYAVRSVPASQIPGLSGQHCSTRAEIEIQEGLPPQAARETTLHELVHAVDVAADTDLSESQVARLARGLFALCADNPAYMRALLFPDP